LASGTLSPWNCVFLTEETFGQHIALERLSLRRLLLLLLLFSWEGNIFALKRALTFLSQIKLPFIYSQAFFIYLLWQKEED
jgi:hypothetical protein